MHQITLYLGNARWFLREKWSLKITFHYTNFWHCLLSKIYRNSSEHQELLLSIKIITSFDQLARLFHSLVRKDTQCPHSWFIRAHTKIEMSFCTLSHSSFLIHSSLISPLALECLLFRIHRCTSWP
jgi:hypothetical protein